MSDHTNTQLSEAPERIWIAPSTLKKRDGRIYLAPGRRDNEIEYVRASVAAPQEDAALIVDLQRELAYFFGQYHGSSNHREDASRCMENECVRLRKLLAAQANTDIANSAVALDGNRYPVEQTYGFEAWWDEYQRPWLPNGVSGYKHAKRAWIAARATMPVSPSDAVRKAAEEIAEWAKGEGRVDGEAINEVAAIISRHLPATVVVHEGDEEALVDEVQRRMDQVVEAAVEWYQAGREGAEWFEAAEKLGAAIDSLLELRGDPQSQMPRRWCSVHNREEFKYESLEHEMDVEKARAFDAKRKSENKDNPK